VPRHPALQTRPLLAFATLVAIVATGGSLYLSLGLGLIPCRLCWYQRILMYPLVVVLGVAAYEGRSGVAMTVLPLSVLGTAIAAYHSYIQIAPSGGAQCTVGCGLVQFRVLGLAVPNLSLLAFLLITASVLLVRRG
jgi:disulfide bond formation protein DsbB